MPKIDYSRSIDFDRSTKSNRKEMAESVVNAMLGVQETYNMLNQAMIYDVDVDLIDVREINEFDEISLSTLKESIQKTGLQHNLVVRVNGERYTVISGNRRLSAIKELHKEYPNDASFKTVSCKVCQIVGEGEPNPNYVQITAEQEELIYKDTNFENRQLGIDTAIRHIDYLADKIENSEEFRRKILDQANENSKYNKKVMDKSEIIADILTNNLGFSGWSKVSVYRVLKIRELDKDKLTLIANGEESISSCYNSLNLKKKSSTHERKKKIDYSSSIKELKNIKKHILNSSNKDNSKSVVNAKKQIVKLCNEITSILSEELG